ncbi:MAG: hypothetical protein IJ488_01745 [Clostridia bacterium]|nr:hypothetical protein [Clostridia bacterium]
MKRNYYEKAELELIRFDTADIVTTSGGEDESSDAMSTGGALDGNFVPLG